MTSLLGLLCVLPLASVAAPPDSLGDCGTGVYRVYHYHVDRTEYRHAPIVDFAPRFPSGPDSLQSYFRQLIYLTEDEETFVGRINLVLTIDCRGTVSSVSVLDRALPELTDRVARIAGHLPRWMPGLFDGEPVTTVLAIGIRFTRGNVRVSILI